MREPWFWRSPSLTARIIKGALTPAAALYLSGHKFRWKITTPQRASVPVICIGNATLGGVGKTPFAMLLEKLLREQDIRASFLTRGYGGALKGPVLVDPEQHNTSDVGDEALLLAKHTLTVVARDRPAGAKLAAEKGAQAVIMDDGFQNPTLSKDISILLLAASDERQSGVFPAGPYREPMDDAKKRADIVVTIGANETDARNASADFYAWLEPAEPAQGRRVVAFAGLGRPERFFDMLKTCGFDIAAKFAFPDHHVFQTRELEMLARKADKENATLITTEKDFVRLPDAFQEKVSVFPVEMRVNDPDGLARRLTASIAACAKFDDNIGNG